MNHAWRTLGCEFSAERDRARAITTIEYSAAGGAVCSVPFKERANVTYNTTRMWVVEYGTILAYWQVDSFT